MKEKIYNIAPHFAQNILISIFNILAYRKRYGGMYKEYLKKFRENSNLSLEDLKIIQEARFTALVNHSETNSKFYQEIYKEVKAPRTLEYVRKLPIIDKETLRTNIKKVYTLDKLDGIVSKTGGTTGKSLEVLFTLDNMQERFAMLDNFRSFFGYKLGEKTAWFSGKKILNHRDIKKNRFWKIDNWFKIRYYSTFHIKEEYLRFYVEDLLKFQPNYLVGFPSNLLEISKYGLKNNICIPKGIIKAIFPTAETVTSLTRETIESFFNSKVYDQYASSEGAPFIFECVNNKLHLELQSGVFEVLDNQDLPSNIGRLVVTSFTTCGTPLIRYDIGDSLELSDEVCTCGNNNPIAKQILGRIDDYVYSPENGKINLGNISNCLKNTKGIIKFQVIQNELNMLRIDVIVDDNIYSPKTEKIFLNNWRDRIGEVMEIELNIVKDIALETSGKYRMVINNIKNLID